jgi:hypothetical protein
MIIVCAFAVYFGVYVTIMGANVAWQAWFAHAPMIEKFYAGTWNWHDAVQRFSEHGMFGYNLLLLVNLKYFHLNVFYDIYLNAFTVVSVGLIVAASYYRAEFLSHRSSGIVALFFIPVALSIFSVCQQSSGAMETQVRLGTLFFLYAAFEIDRNLLRSDVIVGAREMVVGAILISIAVLVFGTLYSFAWIPAIAIHCLYAAFVRPAVRLYALCILIALVASVFGYVWFYDLKLVTPSGTALGLLEKLTFGVRFISVYLGSATLGRTLWEDRITNNDSLMLWNGIFVSVAYLFSLWLFWRSRMHRLTWLPILMIAYTVEVGLLVLIGRGQMGLTWGTSYWYAVHVKFALAGCLWIFAHSLTGGGSCDSIEPLFNRITRLLIRCCMIIMIGSLAVSNYYDWRRAPNIRRYFEAMIPYGLGPLGDMPIDKNGNTPFIASLSETRYALSVFRTHRLTFYADEKVIDHYERAVLDHGRPSNGSRLGSGWFGLEGDKRWMSGRCSVEFVSGPQGVVLIEGFLPANLAPNTMTCYADGQEVNRQTIKEGFFSIVAHIPVKRTVLLSLVVSKPIVPNELGFNGDVRQLGAIIINIIVE